VIPSNKPVPETAGWAKFSVTNLIQMALEILIFLKKSTLEDLAVSLTEFDTT